MIGCRWLAGGGAAVLAGAALGHATGDGAVRAPAVVTVGAGRAELATGFSPRPGRVVTVAHVLGERGAIQVRDAGGVTRRATVLRRDDALDLALLAVRGLPPGGAFGRAGTHVLVRRDGAVLALDATIRRRIEARLRTAGGRLVARRPALELASPIAPGDSGAPVVRDGRVTGIVFARSHDRAGVAYAVDAAALARLMG